MPAPIIIRPIPPRFPTAPKAPPTREPLPIPFPDGSPPGNSNPNNLDDCPEICVWSKVPTKIPKKIVYTYPNETPVEVFGETWDTEITEGYNLTPRTYYQVFWTAVNWFNQEIRTTYGDVNFGTIGSFSIVRRSGFGYPGGQGVRVQYTDFGGNLVEEGIGILSTGSIYEIPFSVNEVDALKPGTFTILRVVQLGQTNPIPIESTCRFRVYDALGLTVVDLTRNVCPDVTEIPEQCIFPEGYSLEYKVIKTLTSTSGNTLSVEVRGNCIDIKQRILAFPPINITVKTICSPEGCPPPQYKIDCCEELDCRDKKCPDGTATRVLIGGRTLQCVDKNGCVLKEIPYDPKCEKVDCRC